MASLQVNLAQNFAGININPTEKVFETFDVQKGSDGKFYSHYPIKYPLKIGICGYMYQAEIESMFTNDPRQEKFYQPEVDNVTGAQAVRNMILGFFQL